MKKIKIISFILIISFLFVIGCNDNSVTNSGNNINSISGKIENWHFGKNKKLKVSASNYIGPYSLVIDSCMIDSIGNFSVNCVTPPDSLFSTFDLNDPVCYNTIIVNPATTKYSSLSFDVYDTLNETGILSRSSDSITTNHEGQTKAYYFCIDRPCTINGLDSCNLNGNVNVTIWDANFNKGWNTIYLTYNSYNPLHYMKVTQSTSQPQVVKWYYNGSYSMNNKLKKF
jgi:hypothetical protein